MRFSQCKQNLWLEIWRQMEGNRDHYVKQNNADAERQITCLFSYIKYKIFACLCICVCMGVFMGASVCVLTCVCACICICG